MTVISLTPQFLADRAELLVGDQRALQFKVTNSGGAASGELTVQLPAAAWLSLASGRTIPSLAPGESMTATLLLTPAADLALTEYSGHVLVSNAQASLLVPFTLRAVSDATGVLSVATVILRDPFTYEVLYRGTTDAGGFFVQPDLPEGYYTPIYNIDAMLCPCPTFQGHFPASLVWPWATEMHGC